MDHRLLATLPLLSRSRRTRFHLERLANRPRRSWAEVVEWALDRDVDLVGFDVYETLLVRQIADPTQRLAVLADRLADCGAWEGTADDYVKARGRASAAVAGSNLADWYEHPSLAHRADAPRCIEEECEVETALTRPVDGAASALDHLRSAGRRIAFASDMYLPGSTIGELLQRYELRRPGETLAVSGDVGEWKSTGGLYRHLFRTERLDASRAAFVGNDLYVDVAVPSSLGAKTLRKSNAESNRYEESVARVDTAGATIAGAARRARLELDPSGGDTAVEVGTGVVGQTLAAFLLAIRQRCRTDDIRQVVFVARDGDLPFQMADAMPKGYWSGIELRYVHGNRLTWTLAGAASLGIQRWAEFGLADDHSFLMLNRHRSTPPKLLRRLGLTLDDLPVTAPLRQLDPEVPLGDDDTAWRDLVVELTDAASPIAALVSTRAVRRLRRVSDYINGLGLHRDQALIVDVGWRGQTAAVVSSIFADVLGTQPVNYHFGGYGVMDDIDASCVIERYAFDDRWQPAPFHGIDQCIEMFTGAGQPRAVEYTERDGVTTPVFDDGIAALDNPARHDIWAAALRTAELLPAADLLDCWVADAPDPAGVLNALESFWQTPSRAEGRLGAALNLEIDEDGTTVMPMAAPYRPWEPLAPSKRRWRQGSLAVSSAPIRAAGQMLVSGGVLSRR